MTERNFWSQFTHTTDGNLKKKHSRQTGITTVGYLLIHIVIGGRVSGFDSQAGQIGHSVANGSSPQRRSFGAVLARR